jgi:hypothetical protein
MAVKYSVWDLDSQRFSSADEVRAAIRRLLNDPAASARAISPAAVAAA